MSTIDEYINIENKTKQKLLDNPNYQMNKEEIKAHVFISKNSLFINEKKYDPILDEIILDEIKLYNAKVNDMNGLKKQIEMYYNNPEKIDLIENDIERDFYQKIIEIYAEKKNKTLDNKDKALSLKMSNNEAGFISLIFVSSLLIFLLFLFLTLS